MAHRHHRGEVYRHLRLLARNPLKLLSEPEVLQHHPGEALRLLYLAKLKIYVLAVHQLLLGVALVLPLLLGVMVLEHRQVEECHQHLLAEVPPLHRPAEALLLHRLVGELPLLHRVEVQRHPLDEVLLLREEEASQHLEPAALQEEDQEDQPDPT